MVTARLWDLLAPALAFMVLSLVLCTDRLPMALDNQGVGTLALSVSVDRTGSGETLPVDGIGGVVVKVADRFDSALFADTIPYEERGVRIPGLPAGKVLVSLTALDLYGGPRFYGETTAQVGAGRVARPEVVVRSLGPVTLLVTYPPRDSLPVTSETILVTGTVQADSGIAAVYVNSARAVLVGSNWSCGVGLEAGANAVTVLAESRDGHQERRSLAVVRSGAANNGGPRLVVTWPRRPVDTLCQGAAVLCGTVADADSVVQVMVNDIYPAVRRENLWRYSYTFAGPTDIVRITATDASGASVTRKIILTKAESCGDSIAPDLFIHRLVGRGDTVVAAGAAIDGGMAGRVTVVVDTFSVAVVPDSFGLFDAALVVPGITGTLQATVTAEDPAGNVTSVTRSVLLGSAAHDTLSLYTQPLKIVAGEERSIDKSGLAIGGYSGGDDEVVYHLTAVPASGLLRTGGAELAVGDSFTQAALATASLRYVHTASSHGEDQFRFTVTAGTASLTERAFDIQIRARNTAPAKAAIDTLKVSADTSAVVTSARLEFTDDGGAERVIYTIISHPRKGTLWLRNARLLDSTFTQKDVNERALEYLAHRDSIGADSLVFTVGDGELSATGTHVLPITISATPVVVTKGWTRDLEDRTVREGVSFGAVDLANHIEGNPRDYSWSVVQSAVLAISIDSSYRLKVEPKDPDWYGVDQITVTANGQSRHATYSVTNFNDLPFVVCAGDTLRGLGDTLRTSVAPGDSATARISFVDPDNRYAQVKVQPEFGVVLGPTGELSVSQPAFDSSRDLAGHVTLTYRGAAGALFILQVSDVHAGSGGESVQVVWTITKE